MYIYIYMHITIFEQDLQPNHNHPLLYTGNNQDKPQCIYQALHGKESLTFSTCGALSTHTPGVSPGLGAGPRSAWPCRLPEGDDVLCDAPPDAQRSDGRVRRTRKQEAEDMARRRPDNIDQKPHGDTAKAFRPFN